VQDSGLGEQAGLVDSIEGGLEQGDVVAVGAVDGPADRDAVAFGGDGPLPAQLGPVGGVGAGALPAVGALCSDPSTATSSGSRPMIRSNAPSASVWTCSNTRRRSTRPDGRAAWCRTPGGRGSLRYRLTRRRSPAGSGSPGSRAGRAHGAGDSPTDESRPGAGSSGSTACQTTSTTSWSSARMMTGDLHLVVAVGSHPVSNRANPATGGWSRPRGVTRRRRSRRGTRGPGRRRRGP
jgi:hypothetical protein